MSAIRPTIVPYDSNWPTLFSTLHKVLGLVLAPLALRIEHIGSTAVFGMAAKDVLDIQVSVADLDLAAAAFDAPLARLGFLRRPFENDHIPAGRDDDQGPWQKRLWSRRGRGDGDVNLHVRLAGSPGERLALLFRDWFRAHPAAVASYSTFKGALAQSVSDLNVYTDVKDPVVDLVVTVAETWAAATGWRPDGPEGA